MKQRYEIELLRNQNYSMTKIAEIIGKNKSTISREIKRNSDQRNGVYKSELAQKKALERHKTKHKKISFTDSVKKYVLDKLSEDYSPEQIVGTAQNKGIACVSVERIYQFIWKDKKAGGKCFKHLRTQGKRYNKRGHLKGKRGVLVNRVDIDQRPAIVDRKMRVGDLEMDLVIGKDNKGAILTINDRASGKLKMAKVESKEAHEIEAKAIELLQEWKPYLHTITTDNGKEFANHENIAKMLEIAFYFAKPYQSWQRGANENLNGLVRQYFPKKYDFSLITEQKIKEVENKLNNRPRKRFGFKTPNEIFIQKLKHAG
jgi:IS30 family transposase